MKTKVLLILVLFCACAGTAWAQLPWDGSGTQANPYLIKTTDDLVRLATKSQTNQYSGMYFRLENDLDMNGVAIDPIGKRGSRFAGKFDGNGHVIRNLTINKPDDIDVGLFSGIVADCSIKNLIIDGASITGKSDVGALVGIQYLSCTIENCLVVNSSITISNIDYSHGGVFFGQCGKFATISGNYYYDCSVTNGNTNNTSDIGTGNGDITGTILSTARLPFTMPIGYRIISGDGIYYDGYIYTSVGHTASDFTVGPVTWAALQAALDNASTDANNPTVITLAADITASSSETYLSLSGGRHVILDLNGHRIDRHLDAAKASGHVIQVNSGTSLTIRDSQGGGQITGGYTSGSAGGISVAGTLTLESGSICGNRSNNHGGGLGVGGTFNMTGGSITGNYCGNSGEGSAIYTNSGYVNISGGTITANYGNSAIYHYGHVSLSGSYDISGNTLADGTTPAADIRFFGKVVNIGGTVSPLHPATIVFDGGILSPFTSGWATYMDGKDPELAFTLANPNGQGIGLNAIGEATIGTLHTMTLADGITASATQAAPGRPITLSGARAPITSDDLTFGTYYVVRYNDGTEDHTDRYAADDQGKATFLMPGADATVIMESYCSRVAYIDADGSTKYRTDCILIDGSQTEFSDGVWFVVIDNVKIDEEVLAFWNNSNLILCDGATLTVNNNSSEGISAYNLAIYGQSEGTGRLDISVDAAAAIEVDYDFTLYGGTVNATNTCMNSGCGIKAYNVIVNGGSLTATSTGGAWCFGINISGSNGKFVINGGNVVVNGSQEGVFAQEGDITLGWTKGSDSIYVNSYYAGSISVKAGQTLSNGEETLISRITNYSKVNGKTLRPVPATGDATKSITAHQSAYAGQKRYWATFYHPVWNYVVPVGAQAFTMGSDHALYRIGDGTIIPAGCAVVIMADKTAVELTSTTNAAPSVTGNILKGATADTAVSSLNLQSGQKVYVLGQSGDTLGFYEFTGETIPANKAYYIE